MGFRVESQRLIAREWTPEDRAPFSRIAGDPRVMHYITDGVPWSDAELDEFLERQQRQLASHGFCLAALVDRADTELVGLCGLQPLGSTADVEVVCYAIERGKGAAA